MWHRPTSSRATSDTENFPWLRCLYELLYAIKVLLIGRMHRERESNQTPWSCQDSKADRVELATPKPERSSKTRSALGTDVDR
mmetsp:Transcript_9241/g.13496  ORF Transcript_9241/g.13496 Transcript_9241/m.13496 type:complete len:83 (+) Transcript_9241:84-332(+)